MSRMITLSFMLNVLVCYIFISHSIARPADWVTKRSLSEAPLHGGHLRDSYIILYKESVVQDQRLHESSLDFIRSELNRHLNVDTQVTHRYHIPDELAGATVQLLPRTKGQKVGDALHLIRQMPSVAKVTRNGVVRKPRPVGTTKVNREPADYALRSRKNNFYERDSVLASPALNYTSKGSDPRHLLTGIDIQHKRGNFGKGVTVCIMDTPVNYAHPHLNGGKDDGTPCIGEGCPVIGGYDFLGPMFDSVHRHPGPARWQEAYENPDCFHGTFVASVIIGRDPEGRYIGAAPDASVRTYGIVVCSTAPFNTSTDGVTKADEFGAYTLAYKDNCDILSASIGIDIGWQDPTSEIVSSLSRKGVTAVVSAGNGGTGGPFEIATPSVAEDAIAVGSAQAGSFPTFPLHIDPPLPDGTSVLNLAAAWSWTYNRTAPTLPIKFTDAALRDPNLVNDACEPLGDDVPKRDDYVLVLFQATDCLFEDQIANFYKRGVKYVIRITGQDQPLAGYPAEVTLDEIRHGMLPREQGLALYHHYVQNQNGNVTVTFSPEGPFAFIDYHMQDAKLVTPFSSWGPDPASKLLKPDLLAIGSGQLGAANYPFVYNVADGTSFSCPSVSGAVALYKAVHGRNVSSETISRALKQTATRVKRNILPGARDESNFRQGAGLMNITAAIDLTTTVLPTQLVFGESSQARFYNALVIQNLAAENVTYNISHIPAQSVYLLQKGGPTSRVDNTSAMISREPEEADAVADFFFDPPSLELAPGEQKQVWTRLSPPSDHPRIIMYSGVIKVTASTSTGSVNVPYTGLAGSLRTIPAFVSGPTPFNTSLPALYNFNLTEQIRNDSTQWTMSSEENGTYPKLAYMLQTPSLRVVCDMVKADIVYRPSIPIIDDPTCCGSNFRNLERRDLAGRSGPHYTKFDDVPTVGRLSGTDLLPRNHFGVNLVLVGSWNSCQPDSEVFPPGSEPDDPHNEFITLPEGKYRVLVRALKLHGGDPRLEESWDSYLSHAFEYKASKTKK